MRLLKRRTDKSFSVIFIVKDTPSSDYAVAAMIVVCLIDVGKDFAQRLASWRFRVAVKDTHIVWKAVMM